MSFADELVKISLTAGYSRLVETVERIMREVEGPAAQGLWESHVDFHGPWYEDDGNQRTVGVHLADQDLFLVDVTNEEGGIVRYHISWSDEVEWRKGARAKVDRKKALKEKARPMLPRDPNDPLVQDFEALKRKGLQVKAEASMSEEYALFLKEKEAFEQEKRLAMQSLEFQEFKRERKEQRLREKQERIAKEYQQFEHSREKSYAKRGKARKQELPPFPEWVPLEDLEIAALPVKVERSVVAEAGQFITDLAPRPGRIVEVKKKGLSEDEARAKAAKEAEEKNAAAERAAQDAEAQKAAQDAERARQAAEKEAILDADYAERTRLNAERMAALQPGATVGFLKAPGTGPIKVDLAEGERLMCRCGQSDFYPFCDQACKAINAEKGTNFSPWRASVDTVGQDVVYACGCGESNRFRTAGEPVCDNTCNQLPVNVALQMQESSKRAAEDKAAAERKAAEEKAAAERKAAEEKAAADRKAAEEKAAEERRVQEERVAAEKRATEEAERKAAEERANAAAKAAAEARAAEEAAAAAQREAAARAAEEERARKVAEEKAAQEREAAAQAAAAKAAAEREAAIAVAAKEASEREAATRAAAEKAAAEEERKRALEVAAANAAALEKAKEQQRLEEAERARKQEESEKAARAAAEAEALRVQNQNRALAEVPKARTWRNLVGTPFPQRLPELAKSREAKSAYQFSQKDQWGSITWGQYASQVSVAAKAFLVHGVQKGDRVVILSDARPEWAVISLAVQSVGGVVVIPPSTATGEQVAEIVAQTTPSVFVIDDLVHWDKIQKFADAMTSVKFFVGIRSPVRHVKGHGWTSFLARAGESSDANVEARLSQLKSSDVCTISYGDNRTRVGTHPLRGAKLTFGNEAFVADALTDALSCTDEDRMLIFMPFSDSLNRMLSVLQPINSGCTAYYGEELEKLHSHLTAVQPTIIYSAPILWERFEAVIQAKLGSADAAALPASVKDKLRKFIGCHNLRVAFSGGAPVHANTVRFYSALGVVLRNVYSKSTLSGLAFLDMSSNPVLGSVGKPIAGVQARINNHVLEVQGPNVFQGYHGGAAVNGWFSTGDHATIGTDGDVTLLGAESNAIKLPSGGFIHPERIELEIRALPLVSSVIVFQAGNHLGAIIAVEREALSGRAKKLNQSVDEVAQSSDTLAEIDARVQAINSRLPEGQQIKKYKVLPREFSVKEGEVSSTLFVIRGVLLKKYESLVAELSQ